MLGTYDCMHLLPVLYAVCSVEAGAGPTGCECRRLPDVCLVGCE